MNRILSHHSGHDRSGRSAGKIAVLFAFFCFVLAATAFAQETTVKGNLSGVVEDQTNAVLPGAKVTVTGANGSKSLETDASGKFFFPLLTPGLYVVKVEHAGFKSADLKKVEVLTNRTATLTVTMAAGAVTDTVEVSADATTVDPTSTAVGANLSDQFYNAVPIQRNVANLFYTSPGVSGGGGTGTSNPSISGGSGLENLYVADGVNITDSAFGGLGVFTRNQGSVGTGINLSFIKEVDVKTGGFEPQYGQATGGIVQIVTKSGSDSYHGAVAGYFAPDAFRSGNLQRDAFRQIPVGNLVGVNSYETSAELAGYVPGFKSHLFFFGSFDPSWTINKLQPPPASGLAAITPIETQRYNSYNYSGKLTYKINDRHSIETSIFGDPSHSSTGQLTGPLGFPTALLTLNRANATGFDKWQYGTKNVVERYNGTLSPTWLLNGSFTWNNNEFTDLPAADVFQITDRSGAATNVLQGLGLTESHRSNTFAFNVDTSKTLKLWGNHTFTVGYRHENPNYDNIKRRSGGRFIVPATNAAGGAYLPAGGISPVGRASDAQFNLLSAIVNGVNTCTICPLFNGVPVFLSQTRGEFGAGGVTPTDGAYHAAYVNDVFTFNRVSLSAGLRWEQQRISGTGVSYAFTGNWSPRIGLAIDPLGDRKGKIYANYGRYSFPLPLDAAIRSLSSELDLLNVFFLPVINGGNVSVVPDKAHLINNVPGGPAGNARVATAGFDPTSTAPFFIVPGTKMSYEEEFVIGVEREFKGVVFSARYLDRRLKRIIEDMGGVSPESVLTQNSVIGNPGPGLDAFVNEKEVIIPAGTPVASFPAGCNAGNTNGVAGAVAGPARDANSNIITANSICFLSATAGRNGGDVGPDGIPDGFIKPIRHYGAWEFEANKSFSKNYLLRVNYRFGELYGNYEGAFRNDNLQTDPGISSLFDFTAGQFNLLGAQFQPGDLPTDRRHVFNSYLSYTLPGSFAKGLTLGTAVRAQSGTPISLFANHPVYQNSGEVPLGGRGSLGRTSSFAQMDLRVDKPFKVSERLTLNTGADLFNLFNTQTVTLPDQNRDLSGQPAGSNPDFRRPLTFNPPFYARLYMKVSF